MSKQQLDEYYQKNYKKYLNICSFYFGGRYLKEDLLHDAYLKIASLPDENLKGYIDRNKLHYLFCITIKNLFTKRNQIKIHKDGSTSTLNEFLSSRAITDESFIEQTMAFEPFEPVEKEIIEPIVVEKIKMEIINGLEANDHNTQVFVMAQIEPILRMSKRTGISRNNIYKSINQVAVRLRSL